MQFPETQCGVYGWVVRMRDLQVQHGAGRVRGSCHTARREAQMEAGEIGLRTWRPLGCRLSIVS